MLSARIEVVPAAPDEEPILANLVQLYAHDFSEFHDLELGADGRFDYKHLPLYWRDQDRHPFLVRIDGKLAGFVLVKRGSEISNNATVWDMAEFFVVRGHRRRGIGTGVAHQVWGRFPGMWEIRVMESNHAAHQFWAHAIAAFIGEAIQPVGVQRNGERWHLFSFESKPPTES
jgi:predicted acetyltransferase